MIHFLNNATCCLHRKIAKAFTKIFVGWKRSLLSPTEVFWPIESDRPSRVKANEGGKFMCIVIHCHCHTDSGEEYAFVLDNDAVADNFLVTGHRSHSLWDRFLV